MSLLATTVTSMAQNSLRLLLIQQALESLFFDIIHVVGSAFGWKVTLPLDKITTGDPATAFLFDYLFDQLLILVETGLITWDAYLVLSVIPGRFPMRWRSSSESSWLFSLIVAECDLILFYFKIFASRESYLSLDAVTVDLSEYS